MSQNADKTFRVRVSETSTAIAGADKGSGYSIRANSISSSPNTIVSRIAISPVEIEIARIRVSVSRALP